MTNREQELSQTIAELESRLIKAHREHGALEYESKIANIRLRYRVQAQLERLVSRWDDDHKQCARELAEALAAILNTK